jgi:spore germination protein KC
MILLVIIIAILIGTPGCYDRSEIDTLALVAGVGIDRAKDKDKVKVTAQIIKPTQIKAQGAQGEGGNKPYWVVTTTGYTIFDAIRKFPEQTGRKLFWAHNMVVVFGEEIAREGIDNYLDFFNRDPELRKRSWVLVSKSAEAREVLEVEPELERIPAIVMSLMVEAGKINAKIAAADLKQFTERLVTPEVCSFASRVELVEEKRTKQEEILAKKTGGMEPKKKMRVSGAVIFCNDELGAWLNGRETRGLLWVLGQVKSGIIVVSSPGSSKEKKVSLEITEAESKIIPRFEAGEPVIDIEIKEESNLGSQMSKKSLVTVDMLKKLEKGQTMVIKNEIEMIIKKAQEANSNVFAFGQAFHREFPDRWKEMKKDWDNIFPQLQVNVKVKSKIRRVGLVKKPSLSR